MKKKENNINGRRFAASLIDGFIIFDVGFFIWLAVFAAKINIAVFYVAVALTILIYPNIFEISALSATPGMLLTGIYVTFENADHIHKFHIKRAFWRIVSCLPFGFGFWYGLSDRNSRTVYDIKSLSRVVLNSKRIDSQSCPAVYVYDKENGKTTAYPFVNRIVIGRDPTVCDAVLPENTAGVSRCHCSVSYNRQTGVFLLSDNSSTYGVFLENGTKVQSGKVYMLEPDDVFYLGDVCNKIKVGLSEKDND